MLDLSNGFFKKLADSFDVESSPQPKVQTTTTFEIPLNNERQETTEGATLDAASVRSIRSMFLLLDEWDHALQSRKKGNSSEECEISIDSKIH